MDWQLKEEKCGWLGKSGGLSGRTDAIQQRGRECRIQDDCAQDVENDCGQWGCLEEFGFGAGGVEELDSLKGKKISVEDKEYGINFRFFSDRKDDKMFKIQAKSKSYYLKAGTNEERNAWVESLK
eukprot:1394652-Amorphochlora_amoeboformis.AAC.1